MKNRRVEGSLSKTVNLGNYESMKINVGLSYDVSDCDRKLLTANYAELFKEGEKELKIRIKMLGVVD